MRAILYSAPSRLIGHRLKVRLYSDRLDCYLSGALVLTLTRGTRSPGTGRCRVIDYRHFIEAFKRKPQAFKDLTFRDALFPREAYRRTWEVLEGLLTQRQACQTIVALLEMAARDGMEGLLADRLDALRLAGELPDVKRLREEFAPREALMPQITVVLPSVARYDALLQKVIFELNNVESYRGKAAARLQKIQRDNDKADRRRQSSGDSDNHPEERHP